MKLRSFETIRTGKFDIRVYREEDAATYKHTVREPVELKCFCDLHYDLGHEAMAKAILENYLGAVKVVINDWNYNGLIVEK